METTFSENGRDFEFEVAGFTIVLTSSTGQCFKAFGLDYGGGVDFCNYLDAFFCLDGTFAKLYKKAQTDDA